MFKKPADDEMVFAEEALIADAQFAIHNLLEAKGISRSELSRLLEISEARVSQIFQDNPKNLTLRSIARIFHALGEEPRLTCAALDKMIPPVESEEPEQPPAWEALSSEVTLAWLREAARVHAVFKNEANDNIDEDHLVAA